MHPKVVVLLACTSLMEATNIARSLLERRLVACASVGTHRQSFYVWEGKHEEKNEYPLTLKSRLDLLPQIETLVRSLHSHSVPEILALPVVAGSEDYLQWMDGCLLPATS